MNDWTRQKAIPWSRIPCNVPLCNPYQNKSLALSPTETDKATEKKSSEIAKTILENNNEIRGLLFLHYKISYKAFNTKAS